MFLNVEQVSEKTGLSKYSVIQLCVKGELPAINVSKGNSSRRYWRIEDKALNDWLRNEREKVAAGVTPLATKVFSVPEGYVTVQKAAMQVQNGKDAEANEKTIRYHQQKTKRIPFVKVGWQVLVDQAAVTSVFKSLESPAPVKATPPESVQPGALAIFQKLLERLAKVEDKLNQLSRLEEKIDKLLAVWM